MSARTRARWVFALMVCAATITMWVAVPKRAYALPAATWIVAIGNNHGDASDEALLYAERDARELTEVLRQYGGVSTERVRLLIDEDVNVVRRSIVEANAAIRANGSPATALVIFYSGHADAESMHLKGTRLALDELRGLVQGSAASLRLLVVDACRSGTVTRVKGVAAAAEFPLTLDDRVESEGVAILSSSAAGEASQEADRLRGSFFSHHLVNALRGAADRDGNGRVTLGEAYAYTYGQTVRSSGQTLTLQHPTYSYDVRGRGDVVLTTPGSGARSGRLRLGQTALYVISEERDGGPIIAEVSPSRDGAVLALPRGRYFVQRRDPGEYREYNVVLEADQQVDLASVPSQSVRYDRLVRKRGGVRSMVHGLALLGGARGEMLAGEGLLANIVLGYTADLAWASIGLRLRGATASMTAVDSALSSRREELGLGLVLQHLVDLNFATMAFGVSFEGLYEGQHFDKGPRAPSLRQAMGLGFGALFAVERPLYDSISLRIEGGPVALLFRRGVVQNGEQSGTTLDSALTGWAAGGLVWRF